MAILTVSLRLPYKVTHEGESGRTRHHFRASSSSYRNTGFYSETSTPPSRASPSPSPQRPANTRSRGPFVHWSRPDKESPTKETSINDLESSIPEHVNELPWTVTANGTVNFALANALGAVHADDIQERLWVGIAGVSSAKVSDKATQSEIAEYLEYRYNCLAVFPEDKIFDKFYGGYCKRQLWPLIHYQIPDSPRDKVYLQHFWEEYVAVNQAFADKVVQNWKRDDEIWVHDYHLFLVPEMIRQKLPEASIGFYLHSAFPSSDVFRCLAERVELLKGILGANVVVFQTDEYRIHFLQTCHLMLQAQIQAESVGLGDRFVKTTQIASGVHPKTLLSKREFDPVLQWMNTIKNHYKDKILIVGKDKFDTVSGLKQKLLSYEIFLKENPQLRDKVVLIQICASTTKYHEYRRSVFEIVDRISTEYGSIAQQPLVFLNQEISREQYLALLAYADVLFLTKLREGMNLESHEFILSQDGMLPGSKNHGVVVLSEFTGNTVLFGKACLSVNPYNYRQCAQSLKAAIEMDPQERETRWQQLHKCVKAQDSSTWFQRCADSLHEAVKEQKEQHSASIPRLSMRQLSQSYHKAKKRVIIMDYEYALAGKHNGRPSSVYSGQQKIVNVLRELLLDERNIIYLVSSQRPEDVDNILRWVPDVGAIAENGCFMNRFEKDEWQPLADEKITAPYKQSIYGTMEYFSERIPGSWLEDLHYSIILHYDTAEDPEAAHTVASKYVGQINDSSSHEGMQAVAGPTSMVIAPTSWSRLTALQEALPQLSITTDQQQQPQQNGESRESDVDFLVIMGAGQADEDLFRWANELKDSAKVNETFTVNVGSKATDAAATLTQGVMGVLSLLISGD